MSINKPKGEKHPVFTRSSWKKCPGFEGYKCVEVFKSCTAIRCPDCVKRKKDRETRGKVDNY